MSLTGITWGLPGRSIDKYLFGDVQPWSGEKIYRLAGADAKLSNDSLTRRGADVDPDPLSKDSDDPIRLTGSDEDIAKIYLRYRLYTYQPDEMITMMALSGMNPKKLQLDPRLYQYGGLFIYPVGALIGACDVAGLIDVRSDVTFYLDNPDEFGKFYVVARAYSAAWGLLGVMVVFAIARRFGGARAGLLAALLFTLMPVVVCMAHEGKPHLPGAVLMLLAVYFAMRYLDHRNTKNDAADRLETGPTLTDPIPNGSALSDNNNHPWWLMCICCGAALGMVLSSLPIFILIPLVAMLVERQKTRKERQDSDDDLPDNAHTFDVAAKHAIRRVLTGNGVAAKRVFYQTMSGIGIATATYLVTNPYILINALTNREILASNFGNSLAMYDISRIGEGFLRVIQLTAEGAAWPVLVLGVFALILVLVRSRSNGNQNPEHQDTTTPSLRWLMLPLVIPAGLFFVQFVLIGAGKPAEYGRFGIFTNSALAIATAWLLTRRGGRLMAMASGVTKLVVLLWIGRVGLLYLAGFSLDANARGSRIYAADVYSAKYASGVYGGVRNPKKIVVTAEPAPYSCPPLPFLQREVFLLENEVVAGNYLSKHPRSAILLRTFEDVPPRPKLRYRWKSLYYLQLSIFQYFDDRSRSELRETPISWSNKPILLEDRSVTPSQLTIQ